MHINVGQVKGVIRQLKTLCVKQTRGASALGHVNLAILAFVSGKATARVIVDQVGTCGVVSARIRGALVNVELAMKSFKSGIVTKALIRVDSIDAKASV